MYKKKKREYGVKSSNYTFAWKINRMKSNKLQTYFQVFWIRFDLCDTCHWIEVCIPLFNCGFTEEKWAQKKPTTTYVYRVFTRKTKMSPQRFSSFWMMNLSVFFVSSSFYSHCDAIFLNICLWCCCRVYLHTMCYYFEALQSQHYFMQHFFTYKYLIPRNVKSMSKMIRKLKTTYTHIHYSIEIVETWKHKILRFS